MLASSRYDPRHVRRNQAQRVAIAGCDEIGYGAGAGDRYERMEYQ